MAVLPAHCHRHRGVQGTNGSRDTRRPHRRTHRSDRFRRVSQGLGEGGAVAFRAGGGQLPVHGDGFPGDRQRVGRAAQLSAPSAALTLSRWRRHHQHRAKTSHYQRRQAYYNEVLLEYQCQANAEGGSSKRQQPYCLRATYKYDLYLIFLPPACIEEVVDGRGDPIFQSTQVTCIKHDRWWLDSVSK